MNKESNKFTKQLTPKEIDIKDKAARKQKTKKEAKIQGLN